MRRWQAIGATVLIVFVLGTTLAACGPNPTPAATPVPPTNTPVPPTSTPVPPTDTPVPTASPALALVDEPIRSAAGGYSIQYPEGWQYLDYAGAAIIGLDLNAMQADVPTSTWVLVEAAPLGDLSLGSMAGAQDSRDMVQMVVTSMLSETPDLTVSEIRDLTVGGEKGACADISGREEDQTVTGRIVSVLLGDRGFYIFGVAVSDAWVPFIPTFDKMVESVAFFAPEATTVEPEETPEVEPTLGPAPTLEGGAPEGFIWRVGGESSYEEGQFGGLGGMDIGPDGNIYVADSSFGVYVISPEGKVVSTFGQDIFLASDVKVAPDGKVLVASWADQAIYVFSPEGEQLAKWGEIGKDDGEFGSYSPEFLAVCPDGLVYVADENEDAEGESFERIQVFDIDGNFQSQWSISQFDDTFDVAGMDCASDGKLYVSGWIGDYIMVFNPDGSLVTNLGADALYPDGAKALFVTEAGDIYIGTWTGWVGHLDPDGALIAKWGVPFDGDGAQAEGELINVIGVAVDADGNVYASSGNGTFTYLTKFTFPQQ